MKVYNYYWRDSKGTVHACVIVSPTAVTKTLMEQAAKGDKDFKEVYLLQEITSFKIIPVLKPRDPRLDLDM